MSESIIQEDVVNAIREYVNPKIKTGLIIHPVSAMYTAIPILQNLFKSSVMKLVFTKIELENVKEYLCQQEIISK